VDVFVDWLYKEVTRDKSDCAGEEEEDTGGEEGKREVEDEWNGGL
jgi:hypothetical protein